ncbi:MAG: replication-associated recombination protein A, partial [Phenylobacterium sp.]|nr:replication-associated recombination protein A [Phenylobacterium sp.]
AAMEDIGSADPMSLVLANAARETFEHLGSPEGELALAQLTVHLACAPKSNAVYTAFSRARQAARETGSLPPPAHILNAPTRLMKSLGYGEGYVYDHDAEDGFSGQNYFPEGVARRRFYEPRGEGAEGRVRERLERWAQMRASLNRGGRS